MKGNIEKYNMPSGMNYSLEEFTTFGWNKQGAKIQMSPMHLVAYMIVDFSKQNKGKEHPLI